MSKYFKPEEFASKDGAASPQEIAQAISILKHDNIQLSRDDDPAMQALEERADQSALDSLAARVTALESPAA